MSWLSDRAGEVRSGGAGRTWAIVAVLVVLALIYPSIVESLQDLPLIGDFVPRTDSMVVMIVFTMMAVGLNVVVGYAGCSTSGTSRSTPPARTPPAGSPPATSTR